MAILSKWASFIVLQNRNRQTFHHILVDFKANQVFYSTYAHTFCTPNYKKKNKNQAFFEYCLYNEDTPPESSVWKVSFSPHIKSYQSDVSNKYRAKSCET